MKEMKKEDIMKMLMEVNKKNIDKEVSMGVKFAILKCLMESVEEEKWFATLTHIIISLIYELGLENQELIGVITTFLSTVDIKKTVETFENNNEKGGRE